MGRQQTQRRRRSRSRSKSSRSRSRSKSRKSSKKVKKSKRITKKSQTGSKLQVWNGTKLYTKGGLTKKDLKISNSGRIVSKRASAAGKKRAGGIKKWCKAT